MNRSGMGGNVSSLMFNLVVFACIVPFALNDLFRNSGSVAHASWMMVIAAGAAGGFGLLVFNALLAKSSPQEVGTLFVLMIVAQTMIPAIYHVMMTGTFSVSKIAGFVLAIGAAALLTRP